MTEPTPSDADIAARLRLLSDSAARVIDTETVIASAARRSRQRRVWVAATVATVLTVTAAITIPLTVGGSSAGPSNADALPTTPAGSTNPEFRMAPPAATQLVVGGLPARNPTCTPEQITATAITRSTAGGVLGVIRLRGAVISRSDGLLRRCSLPVEHGPTGLLDATGQALAVPLAPGNATSPPGNPRPDIPLSAGDAIWGFAWLGSYCGPHASAVQIPLSPGQNNKHLTAPLTGPQPDCTRNATSQLIDGVAGAPGQPVQPARPDYMALRLTGQVQPGTRTDQLAPIKLTLGTTGPAPVTLDPCPAYAGRDFATARSGGYGDPISQGYLPCTTTRLVIEPGHPLRYTIPATSLVQTPGTGAIPGSRVHVTLGIAGLPLLSLTATVASTAASPRQPIVLGSHGLGPVDFGTNKGQAVNALTRLLGPPSGQGPNTGCGPAFTEVDWGELAVEFHNNTFTGYRDINRPQGNLQLAPQNTTNPVRPRATTATGIRLGDSLRQLRAAYSHLSLAGANRHKASDGISFVDNAMQSPAPPQARIIEIRIGTCGSY